MKKYINISISFIFWLLVAVTWMLYASNSITNPWWWEAASWDSISSDAWNALADATAECSSEWEKWCFLKNDNLVDSWSCTDWSTWDSSSKECYAPTYCIQSAWTCASTEAISCNWILTNWLSNWDGIYWIDVDWSWIVNPMQMYCDMTNDGWGRTLVIRKYPWTYIWINHAMMQAWAVWVPTWSSDYKISWTNLDHLLANWEWLLRWINMSNYSQKWFVKFDNTQTDFFKNIAWNLPLENPESSFTVTNDRITWHCWWVRSTTNRHHAISSSTWSFTIYSANWNNNWCNPWQSEYYIWDWTTNYRTRDTGLSFWVK